MSSEDNEANGRADDEADEDEDLEEETEDESEEHVSEEIVERARFRAWEGETAETGEDDSLRNWRWRNSGRPRGPASILAIINFPLAHDDSRFRHRPY